jgi:hypothetical protein
MTVPLERERSRSGSTATSGSTALLRAEVFPQHGRWFR